MNEFGHSYLGSSDGKDFYSLVDEDGVTLTWEVSTGDDSRAILDGTLANQGRLSPPDDSGDGQGSVAPPEPPPELPPPPPTPTPPPPPPVVSVFVLPKENEPTPDENEPETQRPMANQFGHDYTGTAGGYDSYSLVDADGNRLTWRVLAGDDSRAIVSGSLRNEGQGAAVTPVGVATTPPPVVAPAVPGHRYVGRDGQGNDVYQLTDDAGVVVQWSVPHGGDSRAVIQGTIRNLDASTPATPPPQNPPPRNPAHGDPTHRFQGRNAAGNDVYQLTDDAGNIVRWEVAHGGNSAAVIGGTIKTYTSGAPPIVPWAGSSNVIPPPSTVTPPPNTPRPNPSHVWVGYDRNGNDVYQLVDDAGTVVEWAVLYGGDSRAIIPGTLRNIANGVVTQVVSTTRRVPAGPGATTPPPGGIVDTITSNVSIPQLITAGVIALLTRG